MCLSEVSLDTRQEEKQFQGAEISRKSKEWPVSAPLVRSNLWVGSQRRCQVSLSLPPTTQGDERSRRRWPEIRKAKDSRAVAGSSPRGSGTEEGLSAGGGSEHSQEEQAGVMHSVWRRPAGHRSTGRQTARRPISRPRGHRPLRCSCVPAQDGARLQGGRQRRGRLVLSA